MNHFAEVLAPFSFGQDHADNHAERLAPLAQGVEAHAPLPADVARMNAAAAGSLLEQRAAFLAREGGAYHRAEFQTLVVRNLTAAHSFEVLYANARLVDALHRLAFDVAVAEMPLMLRLRLLQLEGDLEQRRAGQPLRREKLAQLEASLGQDMAPEEAAYYRKVATDMRAEVEQGEQTMAALELDLTALRAFQWSVEECTRRLVLFARGGYGRAELSFGSDIDTGYCLDNRGMVPGEVALYQDVILRMETLLQRMGLETAHQYFEVDEDLSRFRAPETLHTIPAILESRCITGNTDLLRELRAAFKAIMPFERLVRQKIDEYEAQRRPDAGPMNLKEDFGGLRSIQIPLWLLAFTHNASNFFTLDLLHLARQKQLLSLWEVTRLLHALELIYELRNFVGAAEAHYFDREALESGFVVHGFPSNEVNDAIARLYLFRKGRFANMEAFEATRLRLLEEVQRISRRLLDRVLDRTVDMRLRSFRVSIHLGRKQVIGVQSQQNGGVADLRTLFADEHKLLELMAFVAETDYALSDELRDGLSGNVNAAQMGLPDAPTPEVDDPADTPPQDGIEPPGQDGQDDRPPQTTAEYFQQIMAAPFAHRAIGAMQQINDPLRPGMPTLLGRFLPGHDACIHRPRIMGAGTMPSHAFMLAALQTGQDVLNALRHDHPDYHRMLGPLERAALKWSLFLQGMTMPEGTESSPAEAATAADRAVEILHTLGVRDARLDNLVHLLIGHHNALARLSRAATYMDQALAQYLDLADRSLPRIILLYLANLAELRAGGPALDEQVAVLNELFNEADQMLMEIRGLPGAEQSLDIINRYFDHKKVDLVRDTRLHWVFQQAVERGFGTVVLEPLGAMEGGVPPTLERHREELEQGQRELLLGQLGLQARERLTGRLMGLLREGLAVEQVKSLCAGQERLFSWFFAAYPNRYLLAMPPARLAAQMAKFRNFEQATVLADVEQANSGLAGILIYTQGLGRSHTRVAYTMSRHGLNILSGKVNRVDLGQGRHGYCYFFQISATEPGRDLNPRDLEYLIGREPPAVQALAPTEVPSALAARINVGFEGDDHKGYRVEAQETRFVRMDAAFCHIKVVMRDSPFLFYKVSQVFDRYDVELQQSLITTVGNQVVDYFYLTPEDYARLEASDFIATFTAQVGSDVRDVVA